MSATRYAYWWRVTAAVASACAIGSLAGPAFASASRPAGPAVPLTSGNISAPGVPIAIAVIPKTDSAAGTFWLASQPGGTESTSHATEINESTEAITDFTPPNGVLGIATDPTRGLAWVLSSSGGGGAGATQALTEIDQSNSHVTDISLTSITPHLEGLAVDPSSGKVFLVDFNGDIYEVSEASPTAPSSPLVTGPGAADAADGIAVDPSSAHLWVTSQGNNSASEYTEAGAPVGSAVSLGHEPATIAVDPTSGEVWTGNADSTASEFADSSPGTPLTVPIDGSAVSISVDSGSDQVWIATSGGTLDQVTEGSSAKVVASYTPTAGSMNGAAIDPATGQVWSINPTDGANGLNVFPLVPTAPAITSPNSTWFATNPSSTPQTFQFTSSGFPAATFAETGTLPKSVSLDETTGVLSGTPKSTGTFKISITAHNSLGTSPAQSFTLDVGTLPVFTSPAKFTFYTGSPAHTSVHATGVPAPVYSAALPLPAGLKLSAKGLFSGTPTKTVSKATEILLATNALGTGPQEISITVLKGVAAKITTATKATFTRAKKGSFTIKSSGTPAATLTLKSGKLPGGLSFKAGKSGTATISGTARKSDKKGTYKITIEATNGVGKPATQVLTITLK
jgi:hypothetical protein